MTTDESESLSSESSSPILERYQYGIICFLSHTQVVFKVVYRPSAWQKLMTLWPHIWHRNQYKSFSLIDKYCKYLIPKIDLLYFSSNIMKSSVFSRHSVRVQLWIHSVPLHYLPCCLFVKKSVIVTKNSAILVKKLFAQSLTIIDKGWRRSIFGTFVHCYFVHCRCL